MTIDIAALYVEYRPRVFLFIYRAVRNREVAEDMTSDVFCRLLTAVKNGGGPNTYARGYIWQIARNVLIDHWRRNQRVQVMLFNDRYSDEFDGHDDNEKLFMERVLVAPDKMELQTEIANEIAEVAKRLTAKQQQVISLQLCGYTWSEIGEIINVGTGAAKALRHRGIVTLRKHLKDYHNERWINRKREYWRNRAR